MIWKSTISGFEKFIMVEKFGVGKFIVEKSGVEMSFNHGQ